MPLKITWLCVVHPAFIECGACGKCRCELVGGKIEGAFAELGIFSEKASESV